MGLWCYSSSLFSCLVNVNELLVNFSEFFFFGGESKHKFREKTTVNFFFFGNESNTRTASNRMEDDINVNTKPYKVSKNKRKIFVCEIATMCDWLAIVSCIQSKCVSEWVSVTPRQIMLCLPFFPITMIPLTKLHFRCQKLT